MARRVTEEDKLIFNELYIKYGSYAEVARQTGWSASTVSKYIVPNFQPKEKLVIRKFDINLDSRPLDQSPLFQLPYEEWGECLVVTPQEREELVELWKELSI